MKLATRFVANAVKIAGTLTSRDRIWARHVGVCSFDEGLIDRPTPRLAVAMTFVNE
jgi:hypothetical protein